MAETIWTNALGDGDFNNNGNWSGNTPGPGHTPGIFDGTTQTVPTVNLDRGAVAFHLIVTPRYRSNLGSPGSPLIWSGAASGTSANLNGPGSMHLKIKGPSKNVIVRSRNTTDALYLETDIGTGGSILYLVVLRGHVKALATMSFTGAAYLYGHQSSLEIDPPDGAELPADQIFVHGGRLTNRRTIPNAGDIIELTSGIVDQTGVLESNVRVHVSGGVFYYNPGEDVSGKTVIGVISDGIFDARESSHPIGFGTVIQGPSATILGDITAHLVPTIECWREYP